MKKFFKISLSLLVVLVIGYFVYSNYQKTAVLKNVVHVDATSVIKLGMHDIKKTLVFDALSSPKYYLNFLEFKKNEKEKKTIEDVGMGIDLNPYAFVFYTMKNIENTLFTTLPISNIKAFEAFTKKYALDNNLSINKGVYSYAINEKAKMVYAWNSSHLVVAMSPKIAYENYKQIFIDILVDGKLISDTKNSYLEKLADSKSHVTYLCGSNEVTVNFLDGKAIIKGNIFTEKPNAFNSEVSYNTLPNASLQLYFDANFKNEIHKSTFINVLNGASFFTKNNIDVETFLDKSNGVFDLAIKGKTLQKDTVITYEFNDNFDKVAVKTIQEKQTPIITMNLGVKDSLYQYLTKQGAIENKILKAIPYYTFYAEKMNSAVNFSTSKERQPKEVKTSGYFFSLNTDFSKLQNDLQIPKATKITSLLDKLRINAQQLNGSEIVVEGKLTATNSDINIISQLYFGLNQKDSVY